MDPLTITCGHYILIPLFPPQRFNDVSPRAFVRYNGIVNGPDNTPLLSFEIGAYRYNSKGLTGSTIRIPATQRHLDYPINAFRRPVQLEILDASPLEVRVRDHATNHPRTIAA